MGNGLQDILKEVHQYAQTGRFYEMLSICRRVLEASDADVAALLNIGALLSAYGFLAAARTCYERTQTIAPADQRAQVNLANLARDAGEHAEARRLYTDLLR